MAVIRKCSPGNNLNAWKLDIALGALKEKGKDPWICLGSDPSANPPLRPKSRTLIWDTILIGILKLTGVVVSPCISIRKWLSERRLAIDSLQRASAVKIGRKECDLWAASGHVVRDYCFEGRLHIARRYTWGHRGVWITHPFSRRMRKSKADTLYLWRCLGRNPRVL